MNEAQLRSLLRGAPTPASEQAEQRGLQVVEAAFAQRQPARRDVRAQLAIAVALGALLAALMLSPAGATVRDWVGDVFTAGVPDAESGLTEIPGGGRLLAQSPAGPWVVQADGSRRLLGRYDSATWSPRGLFAAAAAGRTLTAVEPDGTPRWSLSAPGPVHDQRWSPAGFDIAYRAGRELRVVGADGEGDQWLDSGVEPVAPAWSPQSLPLLAYVDAGDRLRIAEPGSGEVLGGAAALSGITRLDWSADGARLLESSPAAVRLRALTVRKPPSGLTLGPPRRLPLPRGSRVRAAALSPDGSSIALLLGRGDAASPRSEILLTEAGSATPRTLFATPGRLSELAFSPGGERLLISWADADQWLFVPASGAGRVRAIGGIAAQFAPGDGRDAAFPRIEGWCCPRG